MIGEPLSSDMEWGLKQFALGNGPVVRAGTLNALESRDLIWYPERDQPPQLTERGRRTAQMLLAPRQARYE